MISYVFLPPSIPPQRACPFIYCVSNKTRAGREKYIDAIINVDRSMRELMFMHPVYSSYCSTLLKSVNGSGVVHSRTSNMLFKSLQVHQFIFPLYTANGRIKQGINPPTLACSCPLSPVSPHTSPPPSSPPFLSRPPHPYRTPKTSFHSLSFVPLRTAR